MPRKIKNEKKNTIITVDPPINNDTNVINNKNRSLTDYELKLVELFKTKKEKMAETLNDYENKIKNNLPNDKFIFVKDNVLDKNTCEKIIQLFESDNQKDRGRIGDGFIDINSKRTFDLAVSHSEKWKELDEIVFDYLSAQLSEYLIKLYEDDPPSINLFYSSHIFDNGYQIQKYEKNSGFYRWHSDIKNCNNQTRFITFLFYLNDVIEGGETLFINGKVNPKAGRLLLFPSTWTYMHKGSIPISDNKYILTGWFSLPV
jgi:hypothetical protein